MKKIAYDLQSIVHLYYGILQSLEKRQILYVLLLKDLQGIFWWTKLTAV